MSVNGDLPLNLASPISKLNDGLSTDNVKTFVNTTTTPNCSINLNQVFLDSLCDTDSSDDDSQMSLSPKRQRTVNSMRALRTSTDHQAFISEQAFDYPWSSNLPDVVNSSLFSLRDTFRENQNLSTVSPAYNGQLSTVSPAYNGQLSTVSPAYNGQLSTVSPAYNGQLSTASSATAYNGQPRTTCSYRNSSSVQPHCGNIYLNRVQQSAFYSSSLHKSAFQVDYGPISGTFRGSMSSGHVFASPKMTQIPHQMVIQSPNSLSHAPSDDFQHARGDTDTSPLQVEESLPSPPPTRGCLPNYRSLTSRSPLSSMEHNSEVAQMSTDRSLLYSTGSPVPYASQCKIRPPKQGDGQFFSALSSCPNGEMFSNHLNSPRTDHINSNTNHPASDGDGLLDSGFDEDDLSLAIVIKRRKRGRPSKNSRHSRQFHSHEEVQNSGVYSRRSTSRIVTSNVNSSRRIFHYSSGRMISHECQPGDSIHSQVSFMESAFNIDEGVMQTLASVGHSSRSTEACNAVDLSTGYHRNAVMAKPDIIGPAESPFDDVNISRPALRASESRYCDASANNAGYDAFLASNPIAVQSYDDATASAPSVCKNHSYPRNRMDNSINSASLTQHSPSPSQTLSNGELDSGHVFGHYTGLYGQCSGSSTAFGNALNTTNHGQPSCAWDVAYLKTNSEPVNFSEEPMASMPGLNCSSKAPTLDQSASNLLRENSLKEEPDNPALRSREISPPNHDFDAYLDNFFHLGESNDFVSDEESPAYEKVSAVPQQGTGIPTPTTNEYGAQNPNNATNIASHDQQTVNFMEFSSIDCLDSSPGNSTGAPSYHNQPIKQAPQDIFGARKPASSRDLRMDVPSYLARRAFDEGRYWDVFRIIRDNVFPDEQKPFLRRIWSKAVVSSYTWVTSLPVSKRQKATMGQQIPVPESIKEGQDEVQFEVITVE